MPAKLPLPVSKSTLHPLHPGHIALEIPHRPHFVNSYVRVAVEMPPVSTVPFDELEFLVAEGPEGGVVSPSRDATFDPQKPSILLLVGYKPGAYRLQARKLGTTAILAESKFKVTDLWTDRHASPSKWFQGIIPVSIGEATWGGGPSGQPQNYNVHPATGTRKVGVLFVDTADQRYTTDGTALNALFDKWQQMITDGFVGTDGVSRSVKKFYNEASYNGLDITATVFRNVVQLGGHFTDYFFFNSTSEWQPQGELATECATNAANNLSLDLTSFDMLVFVTQPVTTKPSGAPSGSPNAPWIAWPWGGFSAATTTSFGNVTARGVSMPFSWGDGTTLDISGGRTIYETLSHELGHTLGLPDEYTPSVPGRNLAPGAGEAGAFGNISWDPMGWEQPWPHFTLAHRLQLGWVQPGWLKLYNFQGNPGTQIDETVTLHPIEEGAPPAGRFAGIEVRIADGANYYFEYRSKQGAQLGDQALTPNAVAVGVDVVEPPATSPISRPDMLLLAQHADDNGAVLANGQFYHEVDNSSPTYPADFRVDVSNDDGAKADLRVRYEVIGKPDPSIRPWPRDSQHQWQSPDIDVTNVRAQANPSQWANVPWLGHDNTVTAHVANRGTVSAPAVVVDFFVKDYTVTGAPETFLGFDRQDIAPGATVDFTTHWTPPTPSDPSTALHYCIIARIEPYQTPTNPPVFEMSAANNEAQSNYDAFISATSSPPSRELTYVSVYNPYAKPTLAYIGFAQNNPIFRSYLEHTWLWLQPHEHRRIRAMFEYAPDALDQLQQYESALRTNVRGSGKFDRTRNIVSLVGYLEDPEDKRRHGPVRVSGAGVHVIAAQGTKFGRVSVQGETITGSVTGANGQPPPAGGTVIITFGSDPEATVQVRPASDGVFTVTVPELPSKWTATYVGPNGYGGSTLDYPPGVGGEKGGPGAPGTDPGHVPPSGGAPEACHREEEPLVEININIRVRGSASVKVGESVHDRDRRLEHKRHPDDDDRCEET